MTAWRASGHYLASVGGGAALLLLASCQNAEPPVNEAAIRAKAAPVAAAFQQQLGAELKNALSVGGPTKAIEVCHSAAPAIAARMSEQHGASIKRVAVKNRNPDGAAQGKAAEILNLWIGAGPLDPHGQPKSQVWQDEQGSHFLQAIPMKAEPCAACHGTEIAREVQVKLDALYPADKATGFAPGQTRGALLISWAKMPSE